MRCMGRVRLSDWSAGLLACMPVAREIADLTQTSSRRATQAPYLTKRQPRSGHSGLALATPGAMERVASLAARIPGASGAVKLAASLAAPAQAQLALLLEAIVAAGESRSALGVGQGSSEANSGPAPSERTGTGFATLPAMPWTSPRAKADVEVCEDAWLLHGTKAGTVVVRRHGQLWALVGALS